MIRSGAVCCRHAWSRRASWVVLPGRSRVAVGATARYIQLTTSSDLGSNDMQARIKRNLVLSLAVAAASALAACGGGGGSDSGSSPSTGQVQGKAVDFYLSQANVVFTDCNNQATTTDSTGNFTFPSGCSKSAVSYTHLRAHETEADLVCRLLLEKKKQNLQRQ
uniref:Uncharacterized protein n=1 Tax=Ralstonia solanacearum TaxID=305 RepID=A0A0S4X550_RALSL|nr:protein of unknown function [Ralstonia solanacearum]